MSEPDKLDHWKSLADKVGAKVPDEPIKAEGESDPAPVVKVAPPAPIERPKLKRTEPRPVRKNHWGSLAGELGLEVTIDEPEVEEPPAIVGDSIPVGETVTHSVDENHWLTETDDSEMSQDLDDDFEPSSGDSVVAAEEDSNFADEPPMFDVVADDEFSFDDRETNRESTWGVTDELVVDVATDDGEVQGDEAAETKSEAEGEDGRRPRKRRRRRRRGGRGKGEEGADGEKDEPRKIKASEDDAAANTDDGDDDDDDGSSDDGDDSSDDGHLKHRNIPTWQDAIGVVIDSNIEAHSKSPSQRPRGRGRGRGNRKPS